MSNVVPLRRSRPSLVAAPDVFDQAWAIFPHIGKLRSSRKEALPEWLRAVREVGAEALLGAVRRYVSEDKEHKKECGPPGFHRWLKWGRYEHWLPSADAVSGGHRFADERARAAMVEATSEAFVVSYLDPCEIDGSVLVVRTGVAVSKLSEKAELLKGLGFTAMRRIKASQP